MVTGTATPRGLPRFKVPYIRQWRQLRELSLEAVAARVPMDKGNLSRVERGILPYNQEMLELLADVLSAEPSYLIGRDPTKEGKVISMIDRLEPQQLRQVEAMIEAYLKAASA